MTQRFAVVASLVVLTACATAQVFHPSNGNVVYGSRWIALPLPDSRIMPGAIVSIQKGQIAWESNLATCGAPARTLTPVASAGSSIVATRNADYDASAVLRIKGVEAGPQFDRVRKVSLTLDDHAAIGLDAIELGLWLHAPGTQLSPVCREFLTRKNVFIVQEAYRASKGRFTLYDANNRKIGLTGLTIGPLSLQANASAAVTAEGDLAFNEPMYTAVRRVKLMSDGSLKTLGGGDERDDDDLARALLEGRRDSDRP